jgi:F-type H+-transporting ATPase subunit b
MAEGSRLGKNLGIRTSNGNLGIRSELRSPTRVGGDAPSIESAHHRNCESGSSVNTSSEDRKFRIEAETISGLGAVKVRLQLEPKRIAGSVFVACALFAGAAVASEGGLVLLPDLTGKLPILIVLFALLVYPVNAILFKPIFQVLDAREERTAGTRSKAEKIMSNAEETLAKYESAVREVRAEAEQARKSEAAAAREENATVVNAARAESERQLERARNELEDALAQSRQTLRAGAQSLADEAATRVLGRVL